MTSEKINQAIPKTNDFFNCALSRPTKCSLITVLNQKNKVIAKTANPEIRIYTELLSGLPKSLMVDAAPVTKRNNAVAANIGNLLDSGT
jgi:hypothetical protein